MALELATADDANAACHLIARWFADYQTPLFRYLTRLLDDEERAADLLQDTFARAFVALKPQSPPDNPNAWLYRIATNLAYDALRRQRRWRWLPLTNHHQTTSFESEVATAQSVRDCLARLRPREAEALLLYEYGGLTCVEIAALTGEEASAVRVRVSRARERFRQLYQKELA